MLYIYWITGWITDGSPACRVNAQSRVVQSSTWQ